MKKSFLLLIACFLFSSHDMYLKLDSYFLEPDTRAVIKLFNGTFDKSENVITRDRMLDVSLIGNGSRLRVDTSQWSDKDNMTLLQTETGEAGTWVAGVSTRPRNIEMAAADFNAYLEHDGVLDMLDWRKENDALNQDAVEQYAKHVKTIFQVGDRLTDDWRTALGYPLEFVPLDNPYELHPGHDLQVQLLLQGEPLANQLVYVASQAPTHDHDHDHHHADASEGDHHHAAEGPLRTDAEGKLTVPLTNEGVWYLRTIYLTHSETPGLTHESNWATLTFAVGQGHSHEHGMPAYGYWIGILLLLGGVFFWFRGKR